MFDWIGDALSWVGDKISGAVSSVGSAISEAVWDIMLEWLFKTIYGAVADFFGMINGMAAEIFELNLPSFCFSRSFFLRVISPP